jgi:sulfatase maturation enzyme AslB (radical SAM superfamily)
VPPFYIHSIDELPADAPLLLYGAGARGRTLAEAAAARGQRVLGFVDSFNSGEFMGLPVHALAQLPEVLAGPQAAGALLVVTSAFHHKIAQGLAQIGITGQHVFLDPTEGPPLVDVPVRDMPRELARHTHTLCATRRHPGRKAAAPEKRLRCSSFSTVYFRPSGLTLCCWLPDMVELPENAGPQEFRAALERLMDLRRELVDALDQGENPFCASCPELYETGRHALPERLRGVHLDVSTKCNLNCSYCIVKNTFRGVAYDFDGLFAELRASGLLAEGPEFDWGGAGEPTLYPGFARITGALLDEGGFGLVYTNALRFSEAVERGLRGKLRITCSLDAGTRETYAAVRGVDGFEQVWANIRRYLAAGADNVSLKYIVTRDNCAEGEIRAFAERCKREGVRRVVISKDFYRSEISPEEEHALRLLSRLLDEAGVGRCFLNTAVPEAIG